MDGQPVSKAIIKTGDSFDELDKSVDMRTFQRVDGAGVPQLENGHQYEVRCQLMESWFGYDKKSATRVDNTTFRFYASDIDQSHIKFGITGVRQPAFPTVVTPSATRAAMSFCLWRVSDLL